MKKNPTGVFCIDKKFIVDENEKKVTCVFNYSLLGNKNNPLLIFDKNTLMKMCPILFKKYPQFPNFTAVAVSKMSNEDKNNYEFDIDFGKKLALTKAQTKAYDMANYVFWNIVDEINTYMDKLDDFMHGTANSYDIECRHEDDLINKKYSN